MSAFPAWRVRRGGVRAGAGLRPVAGRPVRAAADKATGQPLWAVEVIDADPQARARTVKIKVISAHQPVLPPAASGAPFVPVEFTGLTVTPYVNQAGRLAYSVKATGVRAPGAPGGPAGPARHGGIGRPGPDGKEAAA